MESPTTPSFASPSWSWAAPARRCREPTNEPANGGLQLAIYSDGMFATGDDVSNRAVVAARPTADLDLVGLATWGDRKAVDKSFDGLRLHP